MQSSKTKRNTIKNKRTTKKIVKCVVCEKEFEVPSNRVYRKCCSDKCRYIARKNNICVPNKMRLSGEEIKIADKLYRYKEWDRIHNFVCEWDLSSLRNAIRNGECCYCNRNEWLGLDRINNKLGHSKINTVICCELCNMTRGNRFTYEEMKIIGKAIKSLQITDRRNSRQNQTNNIFKNQ